MHPVRSTVTASGHNRLRNNAKVASVFESELELKLRSEQFAQYAY